MPNLDQLRAQHPRLIYKSYQHQLVGSDLILTWHLLLEPNLEFHPQLKIHHVGPENYAQLTDQLVFQLGLMEIPTYWKAACSPEIIIEAGALDEAQINWWHDLLIQGQGEFFYLNQIDFTKPNFVKIISAGQNATNHKVPSNYQFNNSQFSSTLIPLGGGKDSIVTLELLKKAIPNQIKLFTLNPTQAVRDIIDLNPDLPTITAERTIDPQLLELNRQGYLNGHTPFSAYLAFLTTLVSVLFNIQNIALSNESSANECNTIYLGQKINHQYSKTWEFEQKFRDYSAQYLFPNKAESERPNYFSFLRPWHELQIAQRFSQLGQTYWPIFRSCNRGQKTNSWCHECPKCLFAFLMLFPFIESEILTKQIFNHNLFDDGQLISTALQLIKEDGTKPFECVGEREESKLAFYLAIKKYHKLKQPLPAMLDQVQTAALVQESDLENRSQYLLNDWNQEHHVPDRLLAILKST